MTTTRDAEAPHADAAHTDPITPQPDRVADVFAILYGVVTTLVVHGYQYGRGNHTVYLLDPLRKAWPDLLTKDWFTTSTLQYHTIYGWISALLLKLGQIERAFVLGYVALAVLLNVAWFLIVRRLGGSRLTYLLSVLLFYLSAAGAGLGVYQFMQDSSFLPSNISSVAMLWGIYFWLTRRYAWSGVAFGVAGIFHLNHAIVGVGLWVTLSLWAWYDARRSGSRATPGAGYWLGTEIVAALCLVNIALALNTLAHRSGRMPLEEFVALYVKLRHPHHYDPGAWPLALWVSFLWPMPFVFALLPFTLGSRVARRAPEPDVDVRHARRESAKVFLLVWALLIVALLGA